MTNVIVVYSGEDWCHCLPPCSREMMRHLEKNERLVSWLQPVDGSVEQQIPAIRVRDVFYSISLRMMKAIWRHVRLRKGFDNVERAPYGGMKLKIPMSLLAEKLRTQSRFNVSSTVAAAASPLIESPPLQVDSLLPFGGICRRSDARFPSFCMRRPHASVPYVYHLYLMSCRGR